MLLFDLTGGETGRGMNWLGAVGELGAVAVNLVTDGASSDYFCDHKNRKKKRSQPYF